MSQRSSESEDWDAMRNSVIGLGERSMQKSYYPELQMRIADLESSVEDIARAMKAVRNSEEKYRTIAEGISDVVWVLDPMTLEILYISPSVERLRGFTPEEVMAHTIEDELMPEDSPRVRELIADRLGQFMSGTSAPNLTFTEELEQPRKDGSTVWTEVVASFHLNAETGSPEVHGVTRDITERRLADERLARSFGSIVEIVSQVVETRDPYTAGHQRRVSELAVRISEAMGASPGEIEETRVAALLHDVGKMSVPAEILSRPGRLSSIEFDLIKGHSEAGYRIISSARMEGPTAEIVYQHHERCDGSGYPRGLTGKEILDAAKVIAVADVVEAMSSHRPYRPALGIEPALTEIERGAGVQFDAEISRVCLRVFEAGFAFSEM